MSFEIEPIKYTDNMKILVDKVNETIATITDGIAVVREQNFVATDNQTEFTLSSEYRMSSKLLDVYVEGIRQRQGIDYEETDNVTVTFLEGLLESDKVTFKWFSPYGDVLLGTVDINDPSLIPDGSIPDSKVALNNVDAGMFGDTTTGVLLDGGTF